MGAVPPEFLADRDLGKKVVAALRAIGIVVHTLPEMFGSEEREAVGRHGVPLFALVNGNLSFPEMAGAFLTAMPRILEICSEWPGGSIWIVYRSGEVKLIWP